MGLYVPPIIVILCRGSSLIVSVKRPFKRRRIDPKRKDTLPPFFKLTNDDDREEKAEYQEVGTYNVILNPESFADFEEYKDYHEPLRPLIAKHPNSVHSGTASTDRDPGSDISNTGNNTYASDDPDTVILRVFEDDTNKTSSPKSTSTPARTSTDLSRSPKAAASHQEYFQFSYDNTPLMKMANKDGRDHQLIYYYKNFVHRHLAQVHRDSLGTSLETGVLTAPDVFERQASTFLPVCYNSFFQCMCREGMGDTCTADCRSFTTP